MEATQCNQSNSVELESTCEDSYVFRFCEELCTPVYAKSPNQSAYVADDFPASTLFGCLQDGDISVVLLLDFTIPIVLRVVAPIAKLHISTSLVGSLATDWPQQFTTKSEVDGVK